MSSTSSKKSLKRPLLATSTKAGIGSKLFGKGSPVKRKKLTSKTIRATDAGKSVFEQLGFSAAESRVLTIKADLLGDIRKRIQDNGMTQSHVADLWEQAQPRVSEIMNGRLESVTIDKLVDYLDRLGVDVTFSSKKRA